ncbi:LysM peptidoglycan-binding domain-containing protein [Fodinisporobacter ferrooxydans]|uniref:LysM peptidoglycan-binding domain-containing protein n=1 Tax=Fodinisporobacter ferrooxydans TaxID=2901836 RepID=A0ABY4CE77_9BACL|nr:LysM peptidoglycan-binding domain-containing protein [Alicyclobacillaceae bacterium MYW30-H2]
MHYVVQKKEKISDIMNKFDIPYDAIKYYNSFVQTEEDIHEGRVLTFPLKYMVLPGDTYQLITQKKLLLTSTELALLNPEIHYEEMSEPVFTTEAGFVTLTFDDGPSVHTERILEILENSITKEFEK